MMKYITLFLCELLIFLSPVLAVNPQIRNGADQLDILLPLLKNKRTGLVINQTSRCGTTPLLDALNTQVKLIRIFAPEHGFRGTADAGETIRDGKDIRTGLPIISLYGKNKKPLPEQLQDLDVMVFDIQDVGAVSTPISVHSTMSCKPVQNKKRKSLSWTARIPVTT